MKTYPVGGDVTVLIPFKDQNGDAVTPTGLSYVVRDENDEIVAGPTSISGPYASQVSIVVSGAANNAAGARCVELTMTNAAGSFVTSAYYALKGVQRLVFLENTFQTYTAAQALALDMPNLDAWIGADDTERQVALIEAFHKLTQLNYAITWPTDVDLSRLIEPNWVAELSPDMWQDMTAEIFADYPPKFIEALKKAQIAEANHILDRNPIVERRNLGLMSESIGESSMMWRAGIRPLDMPVDRAAMNYLRGWVHTSIRIGRG